MHTFSKTSVFTMKIITLFKPVLLAAGWAGSGNSITFSDFSHKPCLMGVLNCGCEQKGNERVERPRPANPVLGHVPKRRAQASRAREHQNQWNMCVFKHISVYNEFYHFFKTPVFTMKRTIEQQTQVFTAFLKVGSIWDLSFFKNISFLPWIRHVFECMFRKRWT